MNIFLSNLRLRFFMLPFDINSSWWCWILAVFLIQMQKIKIPINITLIWMHILALLQKDYKIIANNWFKKENVCVILQKLKHKYLYVSLVVTSIYGSDSYLLNGPLNKKDWLWPTWIFLRWVRKTFKSCHEGCTREVCCLRLIYCLCA